MANKVPLGRGTGTAGGKTIAFIFYVDPDELNRAAETSIQQNRQPGARITTQAELEIEVIR